MTVPLGFVVCGAPLAARAAEVARALVQDGHVLSTSLTQSATEWIAPDVLATAAEEAVSTPHRRPSEQRRTPRPNQIVIFPLTFNTANKLAQGIMDNHATGTLCDALGTGSPILATLTVSTRLWGHPVWSGTLARLADHGVIFLDPSDGSVGPPAAVESGSGGVVVKRFDPQWVVRALSSLPSWPS